MTAAGVWTYTLDNANSAVQALNVGDTLTDTFTVTRRFAEASPTAGLVNIAWRRASLIEKTSAAKLDLRPKRDLRLSNISAFICTAQPPESLQ